MSGEELVPSVVSCNLELPICMDWIMKNNEENVKLEKTVDRILEGSSGDESEEVEPDPPLVAVRRKVSFADAFGLDLVSVKEYDNQNSFKLEVYSREAEEYYISCLFNIPALHQNMEVRLQQQKLELECIELLPGSTTIHGIIRVLNLCFHKAIYVRVTLDGWQSHFDLLAEYMPGSSDGETDCFSFHLVLMPPFQVEGLRVEFCLWYESPVGIFWANNGGTNYIVFCHQRRRSDLKEKESEKEKSVEESNQKGIRSCLKTISKKTYWEATPAEASGEISEQVTPKARHTRENITEKEVGINSCKSLKDCCKTLVDRRRKHQAARLAHVQDYLTQKAMETQKACISNTDESTTSIPRLNIPSRTDLPVVHGLQAVDTPPILMYHQIPLLSLDWGSNTTTPPQANPPDTYSETSHQAEDHLAISASKAWEAFLNGTDTQDQVCVRPKSEVLALRDKVVVSTEDKGAEKDPSQESADRKAMETVKSDPVEQSKDLSMSPSRDQVVDYQLVKEPRVTTLPCSAQGSEPEKAVSELEASRDRQAPHHEHTSGSLSQDTTKASPGGETRTTHDTETQNSEAGDGIAPEECMGSSDTSKVKENTHRAVKDTLTFTEIRDVPLTNRQAEGSSSERKDINKDASEEQVEMRAFCRDLHEEDTESSRKGQDETTTDHSAEIQSVSSCEREAFNENELCTSNKIFNKDGSELLKNEERRFEANEGLKMRERLNETTIEPASAEELVEDSQAVDDNCTDGEEKEFESHATKFVPTHLPTYPTVSIYPSRHLLQTTSAKEREVTFAEEDFELGKTLRNFQEPQRLDEEDELSTPLPSIHLSWVDGNSSRLLSWWREFCSLGHMAKALVYAILFVIFITTYLYDLPTCMALYLFSLCWWCGQGMKQRLDGAVNVD
ncbi:uncharacterized protein LOC107710114 [Sinocyclocheilus rhinocerous]|uniref:uncharacterized protein LOC107710114 n=1 Tax=Sinocyclocheilus rhinocerous TaxID=307959 RepID=UPI0007B86052|nr:PREDICTED: uncharacterized protein LOC107710114 [Sinocyclocheilus rhinocerous]